MKQETNKVRNKLHMSGNSRSTNFSDIFITWLAITQKIAGMSGLTFLWFPPLSFAVPKYLLVRRKARVHRFARNCFLGLVYDQNFYGEGGGV